MNWLWLAVAPAISVPAAIWLRRRSYRYDDDVVHTTAPAWLLPVITALAAAVAAPFWAGSAALVLITFLLALVWAAVLLLIDLDVRRLPDVLTLPAYPVTAVLLLGCSAVTGDWGGLIRAATGAGVAVAVFALIAWRAGGSLGLGDVKLVGVLAALLGWHSWSAAVAGILAGAVVGGLQAAVLLLLGRADRHSYVAYGPALITGSYLCGAVAPIL